MHNVVEHDAESFGWSDPSVGTLLRLHVSTSCGGRIDERGKAHRGEKRRKLRTANRLLCPQIAARTVGTRVERPEQCPIGCKELCAGVKKRRERSRT